MWRFKNLTCVARGPIDTRMARSANAKGACAPCQFHPRSASIMPVTWKVTPAVRSLPGSAVQSEWELLSSWVPLWYNGSRVTFIVENGTVRMADSAVYAMQMIQAEMVGEGERTGLTSEADVSAAVKAMRDEGE